VLLAAWHWNREGQAVWTSKRVLLLGLGFVVFLAGYIIYAYFLGGIDGLPPLSKHFWPSDAPPDDKLITGPTESEVDRKLKLAFGDQCREINQTIKLEIRKKGLVVASDEFLIVEDGKVKLTPFRLATFSEDRGDHKFPEINTISSDHALLTFDQPITSITEVGNRKIIGAELKGTIVIVNNRRTRQKTDDIEVRVDEKPLYYDDKLNKVWTDGYVQLLDTLTHPHPTTIRGKGMEMYLVRDEPEAKQPAKKAKPQGKPQSKPKGDAISGVDHIVLFTNVEMHLYPEENNSGFPGSGKDTRKTTAARDAKDGKDGKKQERQHVVIRTAGLFTYDVAKDLATFETPAATRGGHEQVHVLREIMREKEDRTAKRDKAAKEGELDQMLCDRLTLQFRRKEAAGAGRDKTSSDREIESAHATARPGSDVVLVMDTENLAAQCAELTYHCPVPGHGPRTVLKGEPMEAVKDGHKIHARELTLIGAEADKKDSGQQMEAKGPGQVDLFDRNNLAKPYTQHAFWQDMLITTKDRQGERVLDLLTFTGDAYFLDEEHDQELHGEKLQVWLEPNDGPKPAQPKTPAADTTQANAQQRLSRVEAFENVKARSPEMRIHQCKHLTILFKDGVAALPDPVASPAPATLPPAHAVSKPTAEGPAGPSASPPAAVPGPTAGTVLPKPAPAEPTAPKAEEPGKAPKKPIELWARDVIAYVTRVGPKNELREVVTEGTVHVHQDGSKPEDKGVDIKGEMLRLQHDPSGDILDVYAGDPRDLAELQLGDLFLKGPKVRIDQQKNLAWVVGIGAMTMPSNTTFEGGKPSKPGTTVTVHWTRDMLFNGKDADFHGGVVAYQDNASLKSQSLHVTLDKTVSLKEGQKGGQGAKAERMVAHGKVYIVDSKRDEKTGELVQYQRLLGHQAATDTPEGRHIVSGPGIVYQLAKGSADPVEKQPAPGGKTQPSTPPQEQVMYLTRVEFLDQMNSLEQKTGPGGQIKRRISKFYGNVEVVRLPAESPDVAVDKDRPPKGGMYMKSQILTVRTKPLTKDKNTQELTAQRQVFFRTPEFYGTADEVVYDEATDVVTFRGLGGNLTTLYRRKLGTPGRQYEEIKGRTILYNRQRGEFKLDGGQVINVNN
jgi:lipopolysaccharide export system protein LptA